MVQPRHIPQRDPLARLLIIVLPALALYAALTLQSALPTQAQAVLIATPTIGIVPTAAPTELPTAAPVVVQAAPTFAPPPTPIVVERQVIVEVTAPPVPTEPPPPTAVPPTPYPDGTLIILPTAQSDAEFIASFGPTPDPNAKCAFIGCLPKP